MAWAQLLAGAALLAADRRPGVRSEADARDHLAVGLAQAAALVPGVSRSGAALTAARLRGLDRPAALALALRAALPVTLAACALKGARMAARPPAADGAGRDGGGRRGGARVQPGRAGLLPLLEKRSGLRAVAAYRIALGGALLWRARRR